MKKRSKGDVSGVLRSSVLESYCFPRSENVIFSYMKFKGLKLVLNLGFFVCRNIW